MNSPETIQFIFMSVATPNLEDLRKRSGSPTMQHLYDSTLTLYQEYLHAKDTDKKLIMTHPHHDPLEIDDQEDAKKHKPVGSVTLKTDLTRAHSLASKAGFVATQTMLTRAFILRERVTEALENQWRVGFLDESALVIEYLKPAQFCLMNTPGPQNIH